MQPIKTDQIWVSKKTKSEVIVKQINKSTVTVHKLNVSFSRSKFSYQRYRFLELYELKIN